MSMESVTARTLKYSICVSIFLIVIGLILKMSDITDTLLYVGVCALILCPLLGVIVSTVCLFIQKDKDWIIIAMILIAISAINMTISVVMID